MKSLVRALSQLAIEVLNRGNEVIPLLAAAAHEKTGIERAVLGGIFLFKIEEKTIIPTNCRTRGEVSIEQLRIFEKCVEREQTSHGAAAKEAVAGVCPIFAFDEGDYFLFNHTEKGFAVSSGLAFRIVRGIGYGRVVASAEAAVVWILALVANAYDDELRRDLVVDETVVKSVDEVEIPIAIERIVDGISLGGSLSV